MMKKNSFNAIVVWWLRQKMSVGINSGVQSCRRLTTYAFPVVATIPLSELAFGSGFQDTVTYSYVTQGIPVTNERRIMTSANCLTKKTPFEDPDDLCSSGC